MPAPLVTPIASPTRTTIASDCRVTGSVVSEGDVLIAGFVEGSIRAKGVIHLGATAEVRGDLHAARVVIDDGAVFEGQVRLEREAPVERPRVIPELATPGRARAQRRHA